MCGKAFCGFAWVTQGYTAVVEEPLHELAFRLIHSIVAKLFRCPVSLFPTGSSRIQGCLYSVWASCLLKIGRSGIWPDIWPSLVSKVVSMLIGFLLQVAQVTVTLNILNPYRPLEETFKTRIKLHCFKPRNLKP